MKANPQQLRGGKEGTRRADFGKRYFIDTLKVVGKPVVVLATSIGLALAPCSASAETPKKGKSAQESKEKKKLDVNDLKDSAVTYEKIIPNDHGFYVKAAHKKPVGLENTKVKASASAVVSHVEGFLSYVVVTLKGPDKKKLADPTSYDGEKQGVDQKFIVDLDKLEKALGKKLEAVHLILKHFEAKKLGGKIKAGEPGGSGGSYKDPFDSGPDEAPKKGANPFLGELAGGSEYTEKLEVYVIPGTESEVKGYDIAEGMPVLLLTISKNPETGKYEIAESLEWVTSGIPLGVGNPWEMPNPGTDGEPLQFGAPVQGSKS